MSASGTPLPWDRDNGPCVMAPPPFEGLGGRGRRLPFPPGHGWGHGLCHVRFFRFAAQSHFIHPARPGRLRARSPGTPARGMRGLVLPPARLARGGRHDLPARGPGRDRRPCASRQVESPGLCGPDEKLRGLLVLPGSHAGGGPGQSAPPRAFHRRMHHRRRGGRWTWRRAGKPAPSAGPWCRATA